MWRDDEGFAWLYIIFSATFSDRSFLHVQGFVAYQYPKREVSWSTVFRSLEENKERLGIIDYTISQTTLEQVGRLGDGCGVRL